MHRLSSKHSGFSLTEVLLALAILVIGFMLILAAFPLGMNLTAKTVERTIARSAAQEAFAKIQLYGIDLKGFKLDPAPRDPNEYFRFYDFYGDDDNDASLPNDLDKTNINYLDRLGGNYDLSDDSLEKFYPTLENAKMGEHKYCWDAICRKIDINDQSVQAYVFVFRVSTPGIQYLYFDDLIDSFANKNNYDSSVNGSANLNWPRPCRSFVTRVNNNPDWVEIPAAYKDWFIEGTTIVHDRTGEQYTILKAFPDDSKYMISLDRIIDLENTDEYVWFVPPIPGTDRSPCIGVYRKYL